MTTFNAASYLAANPDLVTAGVTEATAATHYAQFGFSEGRALAFDATVYKSLNADLASLSDADALTHFNAFGRSEGRKFNFDATEYKAANADLASLSDADALAHFVAFGASENRLVEFNAQLYLDANPDLVSAGITTANALEHYNTFGSSEGRLLSFDVDDYLTFNPDLSTAGITTATALAHFQAFGQSEGRAFVNPVAVADAGDFNSAPVAGADTVVGVPGSATIVTSSGALLSNDTDANGDTLTISSVGNATGGEVGLVGSSVVFAPADGSTSGSYTYVVSDGNGGTDTGSVSVVINAAPTAAAFSVSGTEDVTATGTLTATDTEGDTLTFALVDGSATGGAAVVNSDGTFTFTPTANFNGTASFQFTANDGNQNSAAQTATITLAAVNDAPATVAGSAATVVAGNTLTIDLNTFATDPDGDTLTFTTGAASSGTVVNNGDGTASYTVNAGQAADDSFTFTVSDGTDSVEATASIDVTNTAPVATADSQGSILVGQATTINVLSNDTDADITGGANQTLTVSSVSQPSTGVAEIASDGLSITFTPSQAGDATFTYTVTDGFGATSTASVTVTAIIQTGGTSGNDTLIGSTAAETLSGAGGNDLIDGGGGADQIDGGAGDDTITIRGAESNASGGTGTDTLILLPTTSTVQVVDFTGGSGGTTVTVNGTVTAVSAGAAAVNNGNINQSDLDGDTTRGELTGSDGPILQAFENLDSTGSSNSFIVRGASTTQSITTGDGADSILGGSGGNTISSGGGNDQVQGGTSADSIVGGDGDDNLTGAAGNDTILGGAGADTIAGQTGSDSLVGGDGNDVFVLSTDELTSDTVVGGSGTDVLDFSGASVYTFTAGAFSNISEVETLQFGGVSTLNTVTVNDSTFTALGVTTINISDTANATGGLVVAGASVTTANSLSITSGNLSADSLDGGAGNDTFTFANVGGTLTGYTGVFSTDDDVDGNGGTDTLIFNTNSFSTGTLTLGASVVAIENIVITGTGGSMTLVTNNANIATTGGVLNVDASNLATAFTFNGAAETALGVYSVTGGSGNDTFTGGSSADTLIGGAGNDLFNVNSADSLVGGDGDDVFQVVTGVALTTATTIVGGANSSTAGDVLLFSGASASNFAITAGMLGSVSGIETLQFGQGSAASITVTDTMMTTLGLTTLTINDTEDRGDLSTATSGGLTVAASALTTANAVNVTTGNLTADSLDGGAGNDTFTFANVGGTLTGYTAVFSTNDDVDGNGGTDTLIFNTTSFSTGTLTLGASVVAIENIVITGSGGAMTLVTNDANAATGATVSVDASTQSAAFTFNGAAETANGIYSVVGGSGDDTFTGGASADTLIGGAGNDLFNVNSADSLIGGDGDDIFQVVTAAALTTATTIVGGANSATAGDVLRFSGASASNFSISAGMLGTISGIETLQFGQASASQITVTDGMMTTLGVTSLTIADIEDRGDVSGATSGGLVVNGVDLSTANSLNITTGNLTADSLDGGAGNDTFTFANVGGTLTGYTAVFSTTDDVDGNGGTDTLVFNTSSFSTGTLTLGASVVAIENIVITGSGGALTLVTNDANVVSGASLTVDASAQSAAFTFTGSNEATTATTVLVTGGAGADSLVGGAGVETLIGGLGNDTLLGGSNSDSILGGSGTDSLVGEAGADTLTGGDGNDSFSFTGNTTASPSNGTNTDVITDFSASADELIITLPDVAGVNFNLTDVGDATDAANGISLLSGAQGEMLFLTGSNRVAIDVDGNGLVQAQDLQISVSGFTGFNRSDVQYRVGLSGSTAIAVTSGGSLQSVLSAFTALSAQVISGATAGDVLDFSGVAGVVTAFSGAASAEVAQTNVASAFSAGLTQTANATAGGIFIFDSANDLLVLGGGISNTYVVQLSGFDGTVTNNGNGFFTLS